MGRHYAKQVHELANACGALTVLDYGCGKCTLKQALDDLGLPLRGDWYNYDPCIAEHAKEPPACDLVVCTDVLEHIEPELLEDVLRDLQAKTRKAAFFVIHIGPAKKVLPDGRNAHLIQEHPIWWLHRVDTYFVLDGFMFESTNLIIYARPLQ
jgi:hypothetical protein